MSFDRFLIEERNKDLNSALVIKTALDTIQQENEPIKQLKVDSDKKTPYKVNGEETNGFLLIDDGNLSKEYPKSTASERLNRVISSFVKQSGLVTKKGSIKVNDKTTIEYDAFSITLTPIRLNVVEDNSGTWRIYIMIVVA